MKRALITGITGQDGLYLGELLAEKGYEVHGMVRSASGPRHDAVIEAVPSAILHVGDLTDPASIVRTLALADPAEVYNLGGISFVGSSWEHASAIADVTGKGALNLLDAIRIHVGEDMERVRFYQASSSEMYGKAQEVPQHERTAFWPRSPYGVSKSFGHFMTINYRESYGLYAASGILFNHESPRRGPEFVTRKITRAVARISLGLDESVSMGNLDARRDWGFAGDFVRAMWLILQQPEADDYVIATGQTHAVRDFLTLAFAAAGIDDWEQYVKIDPRFLRPTEGEQLVGDATKARTVLGWEPTISFEELVTMMVENDLAAERKIAGL
jgi:GDPmannose 4,6-dehydratase